MLVDPERGVEILQYNYSFLIADTLGAMYDSPGTATSPVSAFNIEHNDDLAAAAAASLRSTTRSASTT